MALRYQRMRKLAYMRISLFSRLFFSARSRFILFLQQRITPAIIDSSSVPINHCPAATPAYVNRKLINTLVSLVSPQGPYGREEEHAMRYYSGGLGQRLLVVPSALGWTWLLGYNASIIARRPSVLISPPKSEPPRPEALVIATPCDLEFSRPGMCVHSCLEKTFALHIG